MIPFPGMVSQPSPIHAVNLIDPINSPNEKQKKPRRPKRIKEPVFIQNSWIPARLEHGIAKAHVRKIRGMTSMHSTGQVGKVIFKMIYQRTWIFRFGDQAASCLVLDNSR